MYKEDKSKQKQPTEFSIELVVYLDEEDQIKEVFELNLGNNIIGSSPKDSTIVINKPEIEKKHLQIEIELDNKTNVISPSIQPFKSETGTQKKLKDGNFTIIFPGKWTFMDLSKEYIFYIAKKYKCIVRKVAKNTKLNRSIEASSNQNSNPIPANKINFLKSLDNIDAANDENQKVNQLETKSDIVQPNADQLSDISGYSSKPKVFGKNFKPKGSPVDPAKTLHTKFKAPSAASATTDNEKEGSNPKQADAKSKKEMEVEKPQKSPARKSTEVKNNKQEQEPVVSLQIPKGVTPLSSKTKSIDTKSDNKEDTKKNDEMKAEQKGKKKRGPNKKKGSEELELSLDLSIEFSDDEKNEKNGKNQKQQMIDEKEMIKIASTDDEDEEDKKVQNKSAKNNQMVDEEKDKKKNEKKQETTDSKKNGATKTNKKDTDSKQQKKQAADNKKDSKINNKRKAKEVEKESKLMEIEEEVQNENQKEEEETGKDQKPNNNAAAQKKGGLKSTLAQNVFGQKKRKTEEVATDKDKKGDNKMKEEPQQQKETEETKKDKKQSATKEKDNKMVDESKPAEDKKSTIKQQPLAKGKAFVPPTQQDKSKKETTKSEPAKDPKKTAKEAPAKSAKSTKVEAKKQEKKKEQKKVQEKRNTLMKNSLDIENEEDDEELSHVINSDGEEEYVLKGNSASKKSSQKSNSKKFNVIFSNCGLDDTDVQNRLSKLGVRIMKNLQQPFNILIMDDFTRRAKTLVALNKGAKIISSQWVLDCVCQEHLIEDIDKYEIKVDKAFAKKHKFDLKEVQQRHQNQNKPIFSDIKFILPDDENYQNILRDDLEHIIMTAGGNIVTEEECDEIEDKSPIKVIFDNDKNDDSHKSPDKNQSKSRMSESKKKLQEENREKLQFAYKKNNFDCVLIESIFWSCLHQKVCNWNDFQI